MLLAFSLLLAACSGASPGLAPLDANADHGAPAENTSERCKDGVDNDGDGKPDCADPECAIFVACGGSTQPDAAVDAAGDQALGDQALADKAPSADKAQADKATGADKAQADKTPSADKAPPDAGPKADLPKADLPKADLQKADLPKADLTKPDAQKLDGLKLDATSCGNGTCNVGESCDGRQSTVSCLQDCPGVTSGPPSQQYCFVSGVCQGPGCP
jgi:hypothetical protein